MALMTDEKTNFQTALTQVLQPLARAMVGQSIPISQATELLKQAYVSEVLKSEQVSPTDSRISVLTGLHRKDVKRLRDTVPRPPRRPMLNASALAVAVWSTSPEFMVNGAPLPLHRVGSPGFDDLVKKARIDLPASTLLTALKEQGLVTQDEPNGPYLLVQNDLSDSQNMAAKIVAFEKNIAAHLEAAADNLVSDASPHFERGAHYNQLSEASIEKLDKEARRRLQEVLVELNEMALRLQDADADKGKNGRFSLGGFVRGQSPKGEGQNDG